MLKRLKRGLRLPCLHSAVGHGATCNAAPARPGTQVKLTTLFLFDWLTMALFRALRGSPGANLKLRVCIRALTSVTSGEFGLLWCLSNSGLSYNLTNASHGPARTSDPDRTTDVRA